jgi:hypothetical protein
VHETSLADASHGNHMVEIVGDAKGAQLAFNILGNQVAQLASVASTEAPEHLRVAC